MVHNTRYAESLRIRTINQEAPEVTLTAAANSLKISELDKVGI